MQFIEIKGSSITTLGPIYILSPFYEKGVKKLVQVFTTRKQ